MFTISSFIASPKEKGGTMYFQLPEDPCDSYFFKFFGREWELRQGESRFFLNGKVHSLKEFLLEAAPHIYRPAPRQIPKEIGCFYYLSPANRTRVFLEYLKTKTSFAMDFDTRQEMATLNRSLQWLETHSPGSLDILTHWRLYKSVHPGMEEEAALHFCTQGRLPEYRSPKLVKTSKMKMTPSPDGVKIEVVGLTAEQFSAAWEFSARRAASKIFAYKDDEVRSVFASSLYFQEEYRLNITPELRAASFAAFEEAVGTAKLNRSADLPSGIFTTPEYAEFLEPGTYFISFSEWRPLAYHTSDEVLRVRQATADKKNWEKFCYDLLPFLDGPDDVLSTREINSIVINRRALKKWRDMGYLVEVPELREGRTTYWRCPLL